MTLLSRNLLVFLITLVTWSAMASAHADSIIKKNSEFPDLLNHSIILGDTVIPHRFAGTLGRLEDAPVLENTIAPGPQTAAGEVVVPELLPGIAMLDRPVIDSIKFTGTFPNDLDMPQTGPEPYVMLLIGLGMIVVAITLHLRSRHQARSGFKSSQRMPFI